MFSNQETSANLSSLSITLNDDLNKTFEKDLHKHYKSILYKNKENTPDRVIEIMVEPFDDFEKSRFYPKYSNFSNCPEQASKTEIKEMENIYYNPNLIANKKNLSPKFQQSSSKIPVPQQSNSPQCNHKQSVFVRPWLKQVVHVIKKRNKHNFDHEIYKSKLNNEQYLDKIKYSKNRTFLNPFQLPNNQINCSNPHKHFQEKKMNTMSPSCKHSPMFLINDNHEAKCSHSKKTFNRNFNCNSENKTSQINEKDLHHYKTSQDHSQQSLINDKDLHHYKNRQHHKFHKIHESNSSPNCCEAIVETSFDSRCNSNFPNNACYNCNKIEAMVNNNECGCDCMVYRNCCDSCIPNNVCCPCLIDNHDEQESKKCDTSPNTSYCESSLSSNYDNCEDCSPCPCRCPQFHKPPPYSLNSTYRLNYFQKCIPQFRRYKECDNLRLPLC